MILPVAYSRPARAQLRQLHHYIAEASSPEIATRYIEAIAATCEDLSIFPQRGVRRDDLRPGLRITHHRGRTVIAFSVEPHRIQILGIFHGGRDYSSALRRADKL